MTSRDLQGAVAIVGLAGRFSELDRFDAGFFGINHREAEILDPQQRVFLEACWEALEDAGYEPETVGLTGVFAGQPVSSYLLYNLLPALTETLAGMDPLQLLVGNAADSLATRVSYKLNLKGPSFTVQAGESTFGLAVHLARQSLLNGECDLALAGWVSIDSRTLEGEAAVLVLKRAEEAVRDRDNVQGLVVDSEANHPHVRVELKEGPEIPATRPDRERYLLPVSARSVEALERACQRLADWLESHPELELADVEHTLTVGRKRFEQVRTVECGTLEEAVEALRALTPGPSPGRTPGPPGEGSHARRVSLPTYPFERRRYWIEPVRESSFHPRPALFTPYEPPRDEAEEKVAAIWQAVLGVAPVGAHDDFFQLGGHSLLAPQILGRVREVFGVDFPLQHVFSFPTPAELAEAIRFIQAEQQAPSIPLSARRVTGGPYPLSFAQERLWFVDRLEPGNPIYNEPRAAHISGALDVARLEGSLRELVRRQEALRTTFQEIDGEAWQVVSPDVDLTLPVVDLSALPEPQLEAERLTREEARRPFDLERGPVLRTTLLKMAAAEHVVLFTVHHIASDGWSLDLLVGEVAALYAGTPLPEPPIQYADFAEWQREQLRGEALEPLLAHWREELAGAPTVLDLPSDRPRPSIPTWRGGWERLPLPGVAGPLDELGRREGASRFMTLLAGFQALLHRVTEQDDLLVGSPVANRTRPEIEGLVGFFVNLLVLRARFSAGTEGLTFRGLLGQVRDTNLRAYEHQDAPFERLVETMEVARDLSRPPLVQALCVLQNPPLDSVDLPGLTLTAREVHAGVARYDLTLFASEAGGELSAGLEFSSDLFEAATARRMLGWLAALLDGALAEPDRRVDELPLLTEAERRQLLVEWQPEPSPSQGGTVLDRFDEWVERTPEEPAVVFGDGQVTYRELADRADRLARHLRRLGVGPETIVGLQLERSPALVIGALGVLRAGGAYLPLDPAYPAERLDWMVEDSGAKLRLTSIPAPPASETGGDEPLPRPEPGDLAYLIYTSGSTGRPKAVMVTHRGLPPMADGQERTLDVRPGDRVLQFSSPSFDASVWELWQALAHGAALVMAPREELLPGPGLAELMRRQGVTHATLPPSALAMLPAPPEETEDGLPRLRTLCVAGEACPPELARRWSRGRRFVNAYGPTEGTVCAAVGGLSEDGRLPIGRPFAGFRLHVLDSRGVPVPVGVPGELCFGGPGLARGYLGRPDLTAQRFVPDPFGQEERLYRTGDLVRRLSDGQLEYLGRIDNQVKLRGVRIELGEIEAALARLSGVVEARVVVREDEPGDRRLVAFVVPGAESPGEAALREALRRGLPEVMVPSRFVFLPELPATPNGKVDVARLARMDLRSGPAAAGVPLGELEAAIAAVWREILKVERVDRDDNFFDLGGHSLLLPKLHVRLREALGRDLTLVDLFRHPTVGSLARHLSPAPAVAPQAPIRPREIRADGRIAIVGLSCRFPGARDADELWRNLRDGVESIRRLHAEDLAALGTDPALLDDPAWVPAVAMPEGFDLFDARFFGLSAREAEVLDPQQRLFLEAAWTALEDAGCDPETTGERVGVFAGAGLSVYLVRHLVPQAEARSLDPLQAMIANMPDSLTARVSYKLGLRGPSFSVQSACSTSMVAVHQARLSLLAGECDVALAGGVSLPLSHLAGYRYQEGSIASPDGHCRAFDARARGTVFGGGAGVVVLKRLEDALADGDSIRAVLLGSAINNDGSLKVGFTAPSVEGQEEVLREALATACVEPGSISYVEAHGTGTQVGDPIEVQALSRVLGGDRMVALGSVKTNFGHLDTAAGVAGLIKTVLALQHRQLPPSLNYETPNPAIDFERSPVRVNRSLADWQSEGPRRAGVSSFGIGGTNAHAVLEEAPPAAPSSPARRGWHLLVLSARTPEALERATQNLADHFRRHPDLDPAGMEDVAWTLQAGRKAFRHRRAVVCRGPLDAAEALESLDPARIWTGDGGDGPRPVAFLLSGQGSQHPGMGRELYESEPVFRQEIDRCAARLDFDLRDALWGEGTSDERLRRTDIAQPALFAFEYALARLWQDWGIAPDALLGHSVGEYVAACLAGVMTLEDALALVAARGRLMADVAPGEMLAVPLPEREVAALLADFPDLSLAAVNEPTRCVVAGPAESIKALESRLNERGINGRRLHTSRAFHSAMMEPVLDRFEAEVRKVRLSPPTLPFVSNVTGTWITAAEATDPAYWRRHLRQAVRFADGVAELVRAPRRTLLEVGPGTALTTIAKRQAAGAEVLASSPHPGDADASGTRSLLAALGRLWISGQAVDWRRVRGDERRLRVPLPTYPFERQRFWIEPAAVAVKPAKTERAREAPAARRLHGRRGAAGRGMKRSPVGSARTERRQPLHPVPVEAVGTETERRIIAIWRDLLGASSIGPRDDFFELGGDSLVGIQLTAALRRTFGVDLPLRDLFEVPRVADMAARVEALLGTAHSEEAPPILPVPRTGDLPLSFGQERLWFLDRLEPDSPLYNIPAALRLTGRLDPAALERSLTALVERHESLRTTFGASAGEPVQVVSRPTPQPLPRIDLGGLPSAERESEAHRLVREEAARPFDLRRVPLLRTRLIRMADEEWVLTINIHHIVSDGWSVGVMVRETAALYQGSQELPELPVQYPDYAVWQRRWLQGEVLQRQLDWWKQALDGAPTLLELPADRPRPAVQTWRGGVERVGLAPELGSAIRTLAQREGATPFLVLMAAFQELLRRHAHQDDLLVGTPVANRNRVEVKDLIGFFVNTLVLRRPAGAETFRGLLGGVKEFSLEAFAHQDLPFERLVEELGVERSLAHSPLFQTLFVLQNNPVPSLSLGGLELSPIEVAGGSSKFDLRLALTDEADGGMGGTLEYAADLFDPATARRLVERFGVFLAAAVHDPGALLADLPLMSEVELGQLRAWNDTDVEYEGGDLCVHELVAAQIERTPDAVAVVFEETTMTYRELGRRAARLAARLLSLGVRPDTRVGICAERSLELPAALNGILRVGACYVPLDPGYPADRLAGMLEDADVPVLVTQKHLLDRLPAHRAQVVLLEDLPDEEAPLERGFSPDLACYAIFTSGSTGRPKGAVNTHRATVNRLLGMQEGFGLTADDRLIQKTPFSFDVSVWEFFWPHMVGARLVVARPEGHRDTAYLADTIAREGITFIHFVPSVLQIFLEEPGLERCASLRRLLVGGEALLPDLARRFYERLGGPCGVELHELYGPAEAAIDVTWHPCRPGEERIPIGPPVTNTRLWVLDPRGRLAPVGVPGELHIEGVQVGRGYLGRPELTAERFVPNPFGAPGSRLYRTGDLARFLPDGEVEYLGRIDHQVKIRGVRVELGEIETALSGHPEVREAVVLARGQGADRALVAYVVPAASGIDPGQLVESMRSHLRARLPESMMPGAFVVLDAMPLSPNLKVDRRALAKIEPELREMPTTVAPRTPTQELLAGLWTGLLGLERVGIDQSFFHAGGHSLMVTRLASRVREAFGVDLPLRTFFEAPTIEEQAARIEEAAGGVLAPPILRRTDEGPAPLSFAQERLWFLDRLQPGSPVYNMPVQLRLAGRLSVPALERSLAEIVRRHEVLRTIYEVVGDEPRQRVTERTVGVPVVDLSALTPDLRDPEAARLAAAEALRPFDLRQGPLVRVVVLQAGAEAWTALFAMHHIAGDGWSYGVLVEELGALYAAFLEGRPSPLPEPAIQYADFAAWQRGWLRGEVLEIQVRYWREALAGAPRLLDLPTDRPRPAAQTFRGGMIRMELAPALVRSLGALAGAEGVTLFMVLAAAFQALLRRYSGADDLLIATAIANRTRPETERLIGFFVNTLVLRGRLDGDPGFHGLLGRTREAALGAYAHQDLPFERLVDELGVERSLSHNPLVQVMIALQNAPLEPLELPGLTLAPVEIEAAVARLDLSLALFETGGGLSGTLEYSADLFDRATVLRLIGHFRALLERAATEPGRSLSELPLITPEERHQLLVEWAGSRRPQPGVSVLRRFEEQAARTPDAVAVVADGASLTFGQLDRRAGAVAARLRRVGVGPEDRVALFVERSSDLVAALLGIWKAGGAYVPLDPSLPTERLAFLLEDSRPRVLITEEAVLDRLPAHEAPVLLLSEMEGEDRIPGTQGEAAYLIYTSGTTGRPKAVLVGHGNLAHTLEATREAFGFEAGDRMPCVAPFSFDIFLFELLAPLLAGGTSVLVGLRPTLDVRALAAALDGMTLLHAVPALMRQVVEEVRRSRGVCTSLRRVFVGGDAVPPDLLADLREVFPAARVTVLYGPTEATILASSHETVGGEDRSLLGRPLPGVELTVVDRDGDPAPAGVPGELRIAGPGVTRGYLGRPELTADRFLPDPRSGEGERVYRSGDLARFRPTGEIEFLGRVDQQVKVRGFRIELGEIEAVLADHPEVSEAVVLVQGDGGDRRLVAYVTGASSGLREYLRDRLPEYMVPSAFVVLPELPLSPNGKVDRKALSRLAVESEKVSEAPRTPAEELLAAIWSDLLGLDRVGVDDNFFERGGHSLMATRLVSRVRDAFGVELPLRAVFEAPTLAAMAARIGEARGGSALLRIERVAAERPPLSFSQERLWFLDRLQPGGSAYNIPVVLRLSGPLDVIALERSFREVAQRHEALRTTFAEAGGVPLQVIHPEPRVPLPVVDLRSLPEPQAEAERLVAEEARGPFDLERGPLMRLRLIRTDEADWLLVLNLHHIVSDGWSMGVLVREVGSLYEKTMLPELPVQYADFSVWQRGWLQGEPLAALVHFWREALAGAPGLLELPMDRPRPAVQSYRGASEPVLLPAGLSASLRALAGREGATPFMVLLAAFQELLRRHSNQDDLLVGTPIANRGRAEVEGLIGFFVNTLALRRPAGARTFRELLAGVRAFTLEAYAHQDLPFEKLVEELGVERSLAHGPLIQVLLALQNNPVPALSLRGLELTPVDLPAESAKFDLSLGLGEVEGGAIGGRLDYAADLFDAATARRLLERFEVLLGAALADPGLPLADLPLLTAAERAELAAWNRTAEDFPDVCLHELIEAQVERTPDALAIVFESESLTYRELDEWASALAAELPAALIGIHIERSLEMVVGLVAILKAGGAYVPIDPGYPAERVAYMIEDSGASVLLTHKDIAQRRGRDESRPYTRSVIVGARFIAPDAPAYMIYTSGSTGRPKGALNSHRGIVNRILWMQREYGLTPEDRVLQKTPFSFDVSVWEFFWPLIVGARLVVARPGGHQDPAYLVETIVREEITTLHFVPSMLQVFVEQPGVERCVSLRKVMASGEALPADLVNRFFNRLPRGVELHNLYGPTEAAVDVTYHACRPGETRIPIGRPVANTRIHVLDRDGREAPVGVAGELLIAGVQVGRGYLHRPDLTAERFVPDAFGDPGARMYRTGDLARWLPEGEVEYLGRIDHQVKIRGFRIELGEIEATLARHPEVREAVVLARDQVLVGYVAPPVADDLRAFLGRTLPEHMVPSGFVFLESMPLTPNGKLDRKALSQLSVESSALFVAPRTPAEELLAGIWADLLGLERVGANDHFFHLGGHSLLATRLLSRLRDAFGVELPLRAVFEAPVLGAMAARVAEGGAPPAPPLHPLPRPDGIPLSFPQERLWFLDQLEPGSPLYNLAAAVLLRGDLDVAALDRSFREVARRHEALRTTFPARGGRPVQRIAPDFDLSVPEVDLSALPDGSDELRRLAAWEAARPFDLQEGPLLRVLRVRLGRREHACLFMLHHIVGDAWSLDVLVREVGALYQGTPLPGLPVQYADFALWQRERLQGETLAAELDWWRRELAGAPAILDLPADRPRPAVRTSRGGVLPLALPDAAPALHALCRREGVTPFMALLASFQALLHRMTGLDDLLVGTPVAGRTRTELEGLIGFFVNTLPLRGRPTGAASFRERLAETRAVSLGAFAHQDIPLERLVEELGVERSLSRPPLVQVAFALQNAPAALVELPGLTISALDLGGSTAKFDLTLALFEEGGRLAGRLEYSSDLFDRGTALRLLGHFQTLLGAALADSSLRLDDLPVLDEGERHQLLAEWNDHGAAFPERSIPALFEEQAALRPKAVAAVFGDERITYRDLDRRAGRLASVLVHLGVGLGTPVGIYLERSLEMVVATLAVLKAGGAYVPLDTSYPEERLLFMLEDVGAPVLITREPWLGLFAEARIKTVCLDHPVPPFEPVRLEIPSEAAAYVIYTSGSTGKPKGVVVPHRAIVRLVRDSNYLHLGPGDVLAQASNTSFDAATFEIWGALLNGGRLVGVTKVTMLSPADLASQVRRDGIGILFLTTALFNQVSREAPDVFAPMRAVLFGGEQVDPASVRSVLRCGPPERLLHVYGPTESTTFASWHLVDSVPDGAATVPIGRPLGNTTLLVLDPALRPVPAGWTGELYIGGDGLAWGYANRPELTAERFVPHPLGQRGERLYRTGDLMRLRPDGAVEFLGRADFQVKIRGFRIELGEVESALLAVPGVREAAVLVTGDGGDRRLVAYVAPRLEGADLREALASRLPAFMVPSAFVTLDALPLNPNGKIDRKALNLLDVPSEGAASAAFVAPKTPAEELLAGIWADLLAVERVGMEDRFFDLGGHSLLATRLVSRVRERFGVEMPLRAVFEAPRLADMARLVEQAGTQETPPILPLSTEERGERPPLSFAQERLWFLDRMETGGALYSVPGAVRWRGELDLGALARALSEIVRRHEALRTTFAQKDGQPYQVIHPVGSLALPVVDLSSLPEPETEIRGCLQAEAGRPFDLSRGPLLRVLLLRFGADDWGLLLNVHHIVSDGWSMDVLVRELAALYRGEALPELPVQYADYAVWQRRWLTAEVLEPQIDYWKEALAGAPTVLELPTDRPRPAIQTFRGATRPLAVPPALAADLRHFSRREGGTLFMTLLAGYQTLLHRYSGQGELLVGSPIANRARREVEGLIGLFVNAVVLRGRMSDAPSFRDLVGRTRAAALGAYAHQDLPFERLVEELQIERSLSRTPVYQAVFALQTAEAGAIELPGATLAPLSVDGGSAKLDLLLSLIDTGDSIAGAWEYSTDLFEPATIDRMSGHLMELLAAAVADPEQSVADLPLLTDAESRQLLTEWNATEQPFPDLCLHHLFEAWAARTPDAVAVRFQGAGLTYGELDRRAERLARRLRGLGVGPERLVGICAEEGIERLAAVLAVFKAGGAYLPLDPAHPAERLAFMEEDAGIAVLLDQETIRLLDQDGEEPVEQADNPAVLPDNLAYVIYTSGSTGRPNGVLVRHRSAVNLVLQAAGHFQVGPGSRVLQSVSFSFDASVLETWMTLTSGATLCLGTRESRMSGEVLTELMRSEGITTAVLTPAGLAMLPVDGLPALRTASVGGDRCPADLASRWAPPASALARLLNCYGPTEATIYATVAFCEGAYRREPPIGQPVDNVRAYVLDVRGQLVPVGVPGELYLGGEGLARGYLDRPALTAERFVPDPFGGLGERLYKTGDLVRRLPDGALEFLGRVDGQVKIRGLRIEVGEIEAALGEHPAVGECAVLVRESGGERLLAAFVVPRLVEDAGETPGLVKELRDHLRSRLPDYMVPGSFLFLESMPLSPTGKVDRRALRRVDLGPDLGAERVEPRDLFELELARIWREVLGVPRVGVRDDFFALGGHSLLAVRLMSRVQERFGRELPLAVLFQEGTIEGIAALLRRGEATGPASCLVPIQSSGSAAPFFCVHPAGGDVLCYAALARHLGTDQPFYGLQSRGLSSDDDPVERLPEMAALYLDEIRRVQPSGPYRLGGWSLGGVIAFEMARQLLEQGEEVALLAILDSSPEIAGAGGEMEDDIALLMDIVAYVANLWNKDGLSVSREELERLAPEERLHHVLDLLRGADFLPPGAGATQLGRALAVYRANGLAVRSYRPAQYPGGLHLFRAAEAPSRAEDLGWSGLAAGPIEIETVPGHHLSLLAEPNVGELARKLRRSLEDANAKVEA